jgi:hypothetical protein
LAPRPRHPTPSGGPWRRKESRDSSSLLG